MIELSLEQSLTIIISWGMTVCCLIEFRVSIIVIWELYKGITKYFNMG